MPTRVEGVHAWANVDALAATRYREYVHRRPMTPPAAAGAVRDVIAADPLLAAWLTSGATERVLDLWDAQRAQLCRRAIAGLSASVRWPFPRGSDSRRHRL